MVLERVAQAHLDGRATPEQLAFLQDHRVLWVEALFRLLCDVDDAIDRARATLQGAQRALVVDDLEDEAHRIDDVITELIGPAESAAPAQPAAQARPQPAPPALKVPTGVAQLQLSWNEGRLIAWAGGHDAEPGNHESVLALLDAHGGGAIDWQATEDLALPGNLKAPAVAAPLASTLGWLVPLGALRDDELGVSVTWMGALTALAVELVAQGRIVPQLHQVKAGRRNDGKALFHVRWAPALIDAAYFTRLVDATPGSTLVTQQDQDRHKFAMRVLSDLTDAIVRTAAGQIEFPAPPPDPSGRNEVGEALLSRLDGTAFSARTRIGTDVARRIEQWASPVLGLLKARLLVQLDPPDEHGGWHARVLVPDDKGTPEPVEVTLTTGSESRRKLVNKQVARLERLFPELLRPGGRRRGEVILSQDEAWRLMSEDGAMLAAAGFDMRVPVLSKRKPTPSLRLTSEASDSVVGARQLANVRWSALFDDVELSADDIRRLAAEARPLVQSRGQWVELDKLDLQDAAAALAERAKTRQLTGAEMLRHALGLEGNPLGGISISGTGWAADLLRSLQDLPDDPDTKPEGFTGELRHYQADALAWLEFLDNAGLGGCLALDMGLGKTPTTLANLVSATSERPGLVIAPPAVVGNWAAEARKFVPDLKVLLHHGASRAKGAALRKAIADADVVMTTYGTAVRDIDALEKIEWSKVVLDEAQAIKNPAADTAQQLRRLQADTRLALTGTPIENGLGDLWAILNWANPGLLGPRARFVAQLSPGNRSDAKGEGALKALNGILVYRRTKSEEAIAAELPDRIDELDHCAMTTEQIGLYQAVLDTLVAEAESSEPNERKGAVLAAITALKQICNHPVNYRDDGGELEGRSGKLDRLHEILDNVFAAGERVLIFTHFATWGERLADHLSARYAMDIGCYHGGMARGARDRMVEVFQAGTGPGALVLSLKAGGTGLNLTAANHVVLYDRWWNPAVEDQARDRAWRIGQKNTVIAHRLVCPGTVDERVEEVVAGKRQIANIVLPKSSSVGDLDAAQLRSALGIDEAALLLDDDDDAPSEETAA